MSETDLNPTVAGFLNSVGENQAFWMLFENDECVVFESSNGGVVPIWSDEALAKAFMRSGQVDYQLTKVSVNSFFDDWLQLLGDEGLNIGVDWDESNQTVEIDPFELATLIAYNEV